MSFCLTINNFICLCITSSHRSVDIAPSLDDVSAVYLPLFRNPFSILQNKVDESRLK